MRRIGLVLALSTVTPAFAAEPIEGDWVTPKGQVVAIAPCAEGFCLSRSGETLGAVTGSGARYEGTVTNPENGKSNAVTIEVTADKLIVSGCAGIICATREWTR